MGSSTQTLLVGGSVVAITVIASTFAINKAQETLAYRHEYFEKGQMAYQSVNCPEATADFTRVEETASFPFNNFDGLTDLAQRKMATCSSFMTANQQAKQAEQQKNLSKALFSRYRFNEQHDKDELTQAMSRSITGLFSTYGVAKLAGSESCDGLDKLINGGAIPNIQVNLPYFHDSCAKFYDKQGQSPQALAQRRRFLAVAPRHPLSRNVQIALVKNSNICSQASTFQDIPNIAKLSALMPVVYINCSQAYYNTISYPESKAFLQTLRQNYPNHSFAKVANNWLFSINQEIKMVKSEIYQSGETIKAKLALCTTTGVVGLGWVIDIWEFTTGRSCGLEERLEDWERYGGLIPWFGEAKGLGKGKRVYDFIQVASRWQGIDKTQSAAQDDQSLVELLKDKQMILLFAHHNPKLAKLVVPRLNQTVDTSKKTLFLEYLK